jgi:altronate dehydratase
MTATFAFNQIARLPLPGDNVAIATRRLEAGTQINHNGRRFNLNYTLLEGHRFAVQPIAAGRPLLSWGLPFGLATRPIEPGNYVCNAGMLEALRGRNLDFALPPAANFEDKIEPYLLDEARFQPAERPPLYDNPRTFKGYGRSARRGVGARNYIVLLGLTSRVGSFVRQLEARLKDATASYQNIDGIVAVAHTEGGGERPNNLDLLLRTLAGFIIHPNVGAVLAIDYGVEAITHTLLQDYMHAHHYPLDEVLHHFLTLQGSFEESLTQGADIVQGWLGPVNQTTRTEEPLSHLKIALQCGGSDAFSGISGNPLAAWAAQELIRHGGSANLAETDELIGAEPYVLQKVKDIETARKFLATVARFKSWAAWHGATAEGNPSGGNKFRGLYNIALKSIGAAMKRHPDTRLDAVIDYGELMQAPGYYFMDSPGNDLESIAGQVAAGCTVIYFVTGNGSITNFPFVPTIKIVTTTRRYELLAQDMDVNAGAYLDGVPMDELGRALFELTLSVASGQRTVGEKAGHAQTQIWRDWRQTDAGQLDRLTPGPQPGGAALPLVPDLKANLPTLQRQFQVIRANGGYTTDQIGLILPTSLCAGQIARMAAHRLNQKGLGRAQKLSRFVSLAHTEGCGCSSGPAEELYIRTLLGYLSHPLVKHGLLLEHGCEKTHNDYFRHQLEALGLDPGRFGWASIQLDGGIEPVLDKIEAWFVQEVDRAALPEYETTGLETLRLGLLNAGPVSPPAAQALASFSRAIAGAGGTVVLPHNTALLATEDYLAHTLGSHAALPTLAYGQRLVTNGFHIMETPSSHWVETLTGLGATGVEILLAYIGQHPMQSHPMLPVLQITAEEAVIQRYGRDLDLILADDPELWPDQILQRVIEVIAHDYIPKLDQQGNTDFQITRGLLGISL